MGPELSRRTEMHLNLTDDVHAALAVHHVHSKSSFPETSSPANPVKVRLVVGVSLHVHWQVKVHHQCHLLHVDTLELEVHCVMSFNPSP